MNGDLTVQSVTPEIYGASFDNNRIGISDEFRAAFELFRRDIQETCPQVKNYYKSILRMFVMPDEQVLQNIDHDSLRQQFQGILQSCYIFRLSKAISGNTHAIFVSINGYANRRRFDKIVFQIVKVISEDAVAKLTSVNHRIGKKQSVFEFLQNFFKVPRNLLFKHSNTTDLIDNEKQNMLIDHDQVNILHRTMREYTKQILDNMISIPSRYHSSELSRILQMNRDEYIQCMKYQTFKDLLSRVCLDAYGYALQDKSFSREDIEWLIDPMTSNSLVSKLVDDNTMKLVQGLLHRTHRTDHVHPSPQINMIESHLLNTEVFDVMMFHPRFTLPLLMCARWFAKICMQDMQSISNNNAHLMLYGQSGAGKSLILGAIASNIPTYTYVTNGRFQNPDILSSALILIDEFDSSQLVTNHYKTLLDIKSSVKVDLKNMHPENVSKEVPCVISSNDEVLTVLRSQLDKAQHSQRNSTLNTNSIHAAIRRLYIVPMKMGQYDRLHGILPQSFDSYHKLQQYNNRFQEQQGILDKLFNFFVAFSLFQSDLKITVKDNMVEYIQHLVYSFKGSHFGRMYLRNKIKIDNMIIDIEKQMKLPELNDTEYSVQFFTLAHKLERLSTKYFKEECEDKAACTVLTDDHVPWPIKYYYLSDNIHKGIQQDTDELVNANINPNILRYINSNLMMPYQINDIISSMSSMRDSGSDNLSEISVGKKRSFNEVFGVQEDFNRFEFSTQL